MRQKLSFLFCSLALIATPALAQPIILQPAPAGAPVKPPMRTAPMPVATAQPVAQPVMTPTAVPVAAPAAQGQFIQSPAYKDCTALASTNPVAAELKANEWLKIDDGVAAHHCRAMALYGQRRFPEAAEALALVRGKIAPNNLALKSYVTRQASKAWLDAGRPDAAIGIVGTQIDELATVRGDNANVSKITSDLLMERARLRITYGQLSNAVQDLDHAVSLTPTNEEVLMERAAAFAQLGDLSLAKQDVASVLKLNPGHAKAHELQRLLNNPTATK